MLISKDVYLNLAEWVSNTVKGQCSRRWRAKSVVQGPLLEIQPGTCIFRDKITIRFFSQQYLASDDTHT